MVIKHTVTESENHTALIHILKRSLGLSTALLKRMKQTENVLVNGSFHRFIDRVHKGDVITVLLQFGEEETSIEPQDLPLDILYEDDVLIALNKPCGIVIHPCAGHPDGTLGNGLINYYQKSGMKIKVRPLGRLDRDTTGMILFAKNQYVQDYFIRQMKEHRYEKKYLGIVHGKMPHQEGRIDLPIIRKEGSIIERTTHSEGLASITLHRTLEVFPSYSLVEFQILTGRTHQIRVHCEAIGNPLLGDTLYGNIPTKMISRQALHSRSVRFTHPVLKKEITLSAPIPGDMLRVLRNLSTAMR